MDYQVQYKKQHRSAKALFYGIFTGLLLIGAAGEFYVGYKLVNESSVLGTTTSKPNPTPDTTKPQLPAKPGLQPFTSQKFNYGFYYQSQGNSISGVRENLNVSELDSGMVILTESETQQPARILEAFEKDPSDTIDSAIKKKFFDGLNPSECQINTSPNQIDKNFPTNFQVATITVNNSNPPQASASAKPTTTCPMPYTQEDLAHPKFFLMDPSNPRVLLFIDASNSSMLIATTDTGQTVRWFDTIQFLH